MTDHAQSSDQEMGNDPSVDVTGEAGEQESYHGYSVDDETQPQGSGDSLTPDRGLDDPLEEGYSPPEKWSPAQGYGNTSLEEAAGESLDQRLAQEQPEEQPSALAPELDADEEVGNQRAGRLREQDVGTSEDTESELLAEDVGIDGAGASAEEASVHVIDEDEAS